MLWREQLLRIRQTAIGVRDASVALAPGDLDRLDLRVKARDRRVDRPVEDRQDVERHERRDALRVWRDRGDLDASVRGGDRLDPVATVRRDVIRGHHAACLLDGAGNLLADRTAVVGVAPTVGDRAQRRREEWLAEARARSARRSEDGARCLVEGRQAGGDRPRGDRGQLVAVVGGASGGKQRIGEGTAAESVQELSPGIDRARDVDRQRAALRHRVVAGTTDRLDRQGGGGPAAAVEPVQALVGRIPDQGERVAAESAGVAVHDGEHRVRRDGRIDRGAARAKRVDAGHRGHRVRRDDHSALGSGGGHGRDGSRIDAALDGPTILRAT